MTEPLIAGERLASAASSPDSSARRHPDKPPPGRPRRRGGVMRLGAGIMRLFAGLAGLVIGLVLVAVIAGGLFGYAAYVRLSADLPTVEGLRHYQPKMMSRIYAGDEKLMAELATERRIFVPINAIPELVKQAFVSAEDQNFWTHHGVDPTAIARAAFTDFQQMGQGRRPIGASTITQQVAKNMLLASNEVTLGRKAREALLAYRIEKSLSKNEILELYLNEIYLGLQSYGVAAAAQAYFNKSLDELTLPEAAFLAALPKAPNNYNPFRFPEAARARRDWVIDRMAEDHAITQEQATAAKAEPIKPAAYSRPDLVAGADWFAEEVRRTLVDKFGADATTQGGLVVRTSFNPALQAEADQTLRDGLVAYDRTHGGWRGPVAQVDASAALRTRWPSELAQMVRPPGMLADWKLAVVLEVGDSEAKLGTLVGNTPRILPMLLAESGWARPPGPPGHRPGPAPRRMADFLKPGDVVMAELMPDERAVPAQAVPSRASQKGASAQKPVAGRPERLALRQIPAVQGALVAIEPATGRVLAMSGGWSFDASQFNRATQANRQPGSSFKPMVYLTALEKGISPSQRFLDAPFALNLGGTQGVWRPGNYEGTYAGPTPLRVALEQSLNLVTVRVAQQIGMDAVAQTATAFHVVDNLPRVLSAALGAVETTVLRQAAAYAGLAEGGREVIPSFIDSVQDRTGAVIWQPDQVATCSGCDNPDMPPEMVDQRKQIADPQSVFQLVTMMEGVVTRGTGVKAGVGLDRAIAGKTGTTQDFNDAWFVGFTPDLVTAVWVGYDNPQSLGEAETGGSIAAPIWHDFMAAALRGHPKLDFVAPAGLLIAPWDSGSGMVTDAFKPGQKPGASSDFVTSDAATTGGPTPSASADGIDSGMGGLY